MLGSGSGRSSLIDSDIVFDDYGLPFFPARRLKGLLRESTAEVLEMLEQAGLKHYISLTIEDIFGCSHSPSAIRVYNLYPKDYKNTVKCLKYVGQEFAPILNKEAVMNAVTDIRQQTAINEEGYAKENSLRTIRVLNPNFCFQGEIEILESEQREQMVTLLALACQNLKRAGSGRNRGWGDISCRLYSVEGNDLGQKAIDKLNQWDENHKRIKESEEVVTNIPDRSVKGLVKGSSGYTHKLEYRITNTSPLLFTAPDGDENMVTSLDYIPGTALHGFFANQFIRSYNLVPGQAHKDAAFRNWFLTGTLCFSNAYLLYKEADYKEYPLYPTPLFFHTDKQKRAVYDLIATDENDNRASKGIGGYCCIINNNLVTKSPEKAVNFHLVRNSSSTKPLERLEGHGDDGGIFHYQAMKEYQNFHGYILGTEESLQAFLDIFEGDVTTEIHVGRSISTQYGRAQITFDKITTYSPSVDKCLFINEEQPDDDGYSLEYNQVVLYLSSPLVLYNSYGYPKISIYELMECLKTKIGISDIKINKSFAKVETREAFASHWKMHEPMFKCWAAGSAFLLEFGQDIDEQMEARMDFIMQEGLGERRNQGYGQVQFIRQIPYLNQFYDRSNLSTPYGKPDNFTPLSLNIITKAKKDYLERMIIATAAKRARRYYENNITLSSNLATLVSSNLLGRLEAMVKESTSSADLSNKVKKLRETALKPLQETKVSGKSLYDDLTTLQLEVWCQAETDHWKGMQKFNKYIDDNIDVSSMYKIYWQVFLRVLRKLNKNAISKKEGGK